jgi:hypothetical protein
MWFNPDTLLDLVPAEQLDADFEGGQFPYEFEPTSYWEQICRYVRTYSIPSSQYESRHLPATPASEMMELDIREGQIPM